MYVSVGGGKEKPEEKQKRQHHPIKGGRDNLKKLFFHVPLHH